MSKLNQSEPRKTQLTFWRNSWTSPYLENIDSKLTVGSTSTTKLSIQDWWREMPEYYYIYTESTNFIGIYILLVFPHHQNLKIRQYVYVTVYIHLSTYMSYILFTKTLLTSNRKLSKLASVYIYILLLVNPTINLQPIYLKTFISTINLQSIYLKTFIVTTSGNSNYLLQ